MKTERVVASTYGPLCYGAETVDVPHHGAEEPTAFTHVLNVRPSEEGWLADATELFMPEYFAKRLVGDTIVYRQRGLVPEHLRGELYRQSCSPQQVTLESMWLSEHMLYCYERNGSFAKQLYGDPFEASFADEVFSDGSDDEYEEDTLDSELLLTEVYIAPDSVGRTFSDSFSPQRPVGAIPPTEQED